MSPYTDLFKLEQRAALRRVSATSRRKHLLMMLMGSVIILGGMALNAALSSPTAKNVPSSAFTTDSSPLVIGQ